MQTFPIIKYLRRLAAARGEFLLYPIELDGHVVMCRDGEQAELLQALFAAWLQSPTAPLS